MATENPDRWPFFRDNPDVVVLGPRAGTVASTEPPVRIFLGTEEAQYRAERIFFWSIEKFRDPARTYEIYLMKNVAGFDRKGWRTGFTKYRFAIPDFAGGHGKAIYNDVDQIYLADPALLFDLDMGSHGYLAISAEETSVMLIDCQRMRPLWNRDTANREGKHALIKKPAQTSGLWGPCDPHWNARDQEYVEGQTKCLHYTALHQQPWHPFPGDYSYHPNPLAYIWYGLEREADAAGYQVFGRDHPSPDFIRRLGTGAATAPPLADGAANFVREAAAASTLLVSAGRSSLDLDAQRLDLLATPDGWPEGRFDLVVVSELLERLPPADIPWILAEAFARANSAVLIRVQATTATGLGSTEWWQMRVESIAKMHPAISWHLDVLPGEGLAGTSLTTRRSVAAGTPRVWALLDGEPEHEAQTLSLARALGWPFEPKRLRFNGRATLPSALLGASISSLEMTASARLDAPWPDLVIACGARSVPVARWLRSQSGGQARLVHLGQPRASFDLFDLIVTTPQDRLPIRPNVLHVAAPLLAPAANPAAATAAADLPRPWTALLVPGDAHGYVLRPETVLKLGKAASAEVARRGGSLLLSLGDAVSPVTAAALRGSLTGNWRELEAGTMADYERRRGVLASVDATIVTAGDPQLLAEACLAGRPIALFDLPKWYDSLLVVRPALRLLNLLAGGGKSYRGTPLQQHVLSRLLDEAITKGLVTRPTDLGLLHDGLVARGLATMLGEGREVAKPKPLDDMPTVVERIRQMMAEAPPPAAVSR